MASPSGTHRSVREFRRWGATRRALRRALAFAFALASATLGTVAGEPALAVQATTTTAIDALDLIELQISYTTVLARYYKPVAPRTLAVGARAGVARELAARGIATIALPAVPATVDFGRGSDYVDTLVVGSIARYGARIDAHRLVGAAVAGELAALHDPYTLAFRPQQLKRFNAFLGNATFGGIGAILSFDKARARATVERAIADGPAAVAGVRAGDAIVAIDGRTLDGRDSAGVVAALRGKIGTTVRVSLESDGVRRDVALVRAAVRDPEVREARFGDTAYLALSRFGDRAGAELAAALTEARTRGARAVVLDLRGNGGGYGDEATAVASLFLGGPVFITRERTGPARVARATMRTPFHERLAVLVDGDTASAAEIVAGAVQDARIGKIVGARTFGKGLVQSIFPLPDGSALKVTTARYTTPSGRDIDRVGISPDLAVTQPAGSILGEPATDPQLAAALAAVASPDPQSPAPAVPVTVPSTAPSAMPSGA